MLFEKKFIKLKKEQTFGDILESLKIGSIYYISDIDGKYYEYTLVPKDKSYVGQLYVANKCKILKCNMSHYIPPQVKLTFTSKADTSVPVYFTKKSYDSKTPDDTISLTANQEKTTIYDRKSIYIFKFKSSGAIISSKIEGTLLSCNSLFYNCYNMTSLDVSKLDTSKVTDMEQMFYGCGSLSSLDLSNFDTSNVSDMSNMFNGCSELTSLDLSYFNTSKVTDMSNMFSNCSALTSLNIPFDTSNVSDMSNMFNGCSELTSLDLYVFDTSKVTNMSYMFSNCRSLTSLDVDLDVDDESHFDTSKVTNMDYMFSNCSALTTLDLSNFDTSNVISMSFMFFYCRALTTIGPVNTAAGWQHKPDFYIDMFEDCPATPKPKWYGG